MSESEIIKKLDEDGEEYYSKNIDMKLIFNTYDDGFIEENIEMMIWEVLNDKAFDNLGWFEKNEQQ